MGKALEIRLHLQGSPPTYLLDGDNMRYDLCRDLGFSDTNQRKSIRRVVEVAKLMVAAELDACERRDPKGLYARAKRGGINSRNEIPVYAPLRIYAGRISGAYENQISIVNSVSQCSFSTITMELSC